MLKKALLFLCAALLTACHNNCKTPTAHREQTLRVGVSTDPSTVDPRQARDLAGQIFCKMLFEGLTRIDPQGTPQQALAKKITLAEDLTTYTVTLRESHWSNGDKVTASDFVESLQSTLAPSFPADNANLLYVIKNAREAKEGKIALKEIGVFAKDDSTLIFELNNPTPFFEELLSLPITFAVHPSTRALAPQESNTREKVICNGPFRVVKWQQDNAITLLKNPSYWDAKEVALEKIQLIVSANEHTELKLFEQGELDWAGSPMGNFSLEAMQTWKGRPEMHIQPTAATYWFRLNTKAPPFDNGNLRRAFALAINRNELITHVTKGNQVPATGIVPPDMWQEKEVAPYFRDADATTARRLLRDGLEELGVSLEQLPPVTLSFASSERNSKIAQAIQQQWREVLGVEVHLQAMDSKLYFSNLRNKQYQIGAGTWFADFNDPVNFLDVFKFASNNTNNTQWEEAEYVHLLNDSDALLSRTKRMQMLRHAEKVLVQEMPVIPLFHYTYCYVCQPSVKGVFFTPIGLVEFKWGHIE